MYLSFKDSKARQREEIHLLSEFFVLALTLLGQAAQAQTAAGQKEQIIEEIRRRSRAEPA